MLATLLNRAPVAQLDRASVYGTEGQRFESSRARFVDESSVLNRIEELVAEEHGLWQAEAQGRLEGDGRERLTEVRRALDQAYKALRRRRAGQPGEGLRDRDVPDPPNDLDGPEPEPPHTEHGVHASDSSAEDPSPNVP
jgi:hypothetical protein